MVLCFNPWLACTVEDWAGTTHAADSTDKSRTLFRRRLDMPLKELTARTASVY